MISIALFCESRYPVNRKGIKKTVEAVLGEKGVSGNVEVSIAVVGDRKMRVLNKKYRDKDATTDVLSFSQAEGPPAPSGLSSGSRTVGQDKGITSPDGMLRLGDVVISFPQVRKNAIRKEVLIDEEIDFLVRHGILHLLGIHHE